MKITLSLAIFLAFAFNGLSQDLTQNIRGKVLDSESKYPLVGAKIKVTDVDPILGGICNDKGEFTISNVPIGKHSIEITSIGYAPKVTTAIVNSGKETIITIYMEESSIVGEEVVVTGRKKEK